MWPTTASRDAAFAAMARPATATTWPQGRDVIPAVAPTPWPGATSIAAARAAAAGR